MTTTYRGPPSTGCHDSASPLIDVALVILDEPGDGRRVLVLTCGHRVKLRTKLSIPAPKRARCTTCPPPRCGATNRAGVACTLKPKHTGLHEGGNCFWSYDARTAAA